MADANATLVIGNKENKFIKYTKLTTYISIIIWIITDLIFKFGMA